MPNSSSLKPFLDEVHPNTYIFNEDTCDHIGIPHLPRVPHANPNILLKIEWILKALKSYEKKTKLEAAPTYMISWK